MKRKFIRKYYRIVFFSLAITIVVFCKWRFAPGGTEINKKEYPITGIDISKYNGKIDWNALKAQGVDFVFIKATEGEKYVDPKFNENLNGALKANIPVGAYHFFRFDRYGTKQALHFIKNAQIQNLTLPLVIDVEEWHNFTLNRNRTEILNELKQFISSVEKMTNQKLIIYTNEHTYQKFIEGNFPSNELWICSFSKSPKVKAQWTFWQYTHKGKIKGIDHLVDINTFWGDEDCWVNYLENLEDLREY